MTWTVTKEETAGFMPEYDKVIPVKLNVRAIIDIDNEQAELKYLIASLQKHVKSDAG